jgi:hypothetical protein
MLNKEVIRCRCRCCIAVIDMAFASQMLQVRSGWQQIHFR